MFVISYSQLVDDPFYGDFAVSYSAGLRVIDMPHAKAVVNIYSRTAFVYSE